MTQQILFSFSWESDRHIGDRFVEICMHEYFEMQVGTIAFIHIYNVEEGFASFSNTMELKSFKWLVFTTRSFGNRSWKLRINV